MKYISIIAVLIVSISCKSESEHTLEINDFVSTFDFLKAPKGFNVEIYAEGVEDARQMARSPEGIIYVGTRRAGKIYALIDEDNDYKADTVLTVASGFRMPNGVAFLENDLYVAEVSKIWKYENIDDHLDNTPIPKLINDTFPTESSHGWKYIAFGPDNKLYVPVGAPCNVCNKEDENPIYASLTRMDADGKNREIIAHGIRNTVGFTWHPNTKNLWFTDNGRDWMGDDIPPCELNELTVEGSHFGFPFLHGTEIWDPEFGSEQEIRNRNFVKPIQDLGAHVAPLGVMFYTGDMFPSTYKNQAFIAEHGSWNRSERIGYQISIVTLNDEGTATSYQPFITGWLKGKEDIKGRPVAFLELPDGSILISDDYSGRIYRVTYMG